MQMPNLQLEENFKHECAMYSGLGLIKQREILDSYWREAIARELPDGGNDKFIDRISKSLRKTSRRK